jgi:hypothetical protein
LITSTRRLRRGLVSTDRRLGVREPLLRGLVLRNPVITLRTNEFSHCLIDVLAVEQLPDLAVQRLYQLILA